MITRQVMYKVQDYEVVVVLDDEKRDGIVSVGKEGGESRWFRATYPETPSRWKRVLPYILSPLQSFPVRFLPFNKAIDEAVRVANELAGIDEETEALIRQKTEELKFLAEAVKEVLLDTSEA